MRLIRWTYGPDRSQRAESARESGCFALPTAQIEVTVVAEGPGYRVEAREPGNTLVPTDAWSGAARQVMESGDVDGLELNYAKGFKDTDLEFIGEWPVRRLTIVSRSVRDLTPLARLRDTLAALTLITSPSASIDLIAFPALESLSAEWAQVASISAATNLQDLYLGGYGEPDLAPLQRNSGLRRLRMKDRPRLRNVDDVGAYFPNLEHLGIYSAPLDDLTGLQGVESDLLELHLERCPITDLASVGHLTSLRFLNASDCGALESLKPLTGLKHLRNLWLFGSTSIQDSNLAVLMGLPELSDLRIKPRPEYEPSVEAIQQFITGNGGG